MAFRPWKFLRFRPRKARILPVRAARCAEIAEPVDLSLPLEPARVKWFDKGKGFGFANVFGRDEDVFLHIEVLRRSGLADLAPWRSRLAARGRWQTRSHGDPGDKLGSSA